LFALKFCEFLPTDQSVASFLIFLKKTIEISVMTHKKEVSAHKTCVKSHKEKSNFQNKKAIFGGVITHKTRVTTHKY
jgi:hypothetical protein